MFFSAAVVFAQPQFTKINSMPGAFSRMGFGARGIGMGNAMSAVIDGNLVSYYNPAISVYQENNSFHTSFGVLSLDRSLNFLNYTRKFEFRKRSSDNYVPTAGLSFGIINSGVSNIDERNRDGMKTGELSTSENQFFLGLANRFSEKISIGLALKIYYYKLYESLSATGLGADLGMIYTPTNNLTFSFVITDVNSKYEWDTGDLFGQDGKLTGDKFPLAKKIGVSYRLENPDIIASVEFENSNAETNYLRFGAEYNIFDNLFVRSGLDKWNLSNPDDPARPALGFSYFYDLDGWLVGVDYAFVIEPYSSSDIHIIGINLRF